MSYHNIRDKYGRFTKAKKTRKSRAKKAVVNPTILYAYLIDKSGSMVGKDREVVAGFNEILRTGRADAVKNNVNTHEFLSFFCNEYLSIGNIMELDWGRPTGRVVGNKVMYSGDGNSTSLWESTGRIIHEMERELAKYPDAKVVVTVFTDGGENSSQGVWRDINTIRTLIQEKQSKGWVINFVGAGNPAAVRYASGQMGIYASNTMNFDNSGVGVNMATTRYKMSNTRYTASVAAGTATTDGFFSEE